MRIKVVLSPTIVKIWINNSVYYYSPPHAVNDFPPCYLFDSVSDLENFDVNAINHRFTVGVF